MTETPLPSEAAAAPVARERLMPSFPPLQFAIVAVLGSLAGIGYAAIIGTDALHMLRAGVNGALIASGVTLFELLVIEGAAARRLQSAPLAAFIAVRVAAWTLVIVAVLGVVQVTFSLGEPMRLTTPAGLVDVAYSLVVSLLGALLLAVRRLLGPGVLGALVSGRYHRPRSEARVFMLLDLVGSTALADRFGDRAYLGVLNRVLQEVTPLIERAGGEIYRYVGDAVIATWPPRRPAAEAAAAAVACAGACVARIGAVAPSLRAAYGTAPGLRAAVHMGPVIAAEIGTTKREIAFLGDTMNTLARLEQAGRDGGRDVVLSAAVIETARLPEGTRAVPLGTFTPRGKHEAMALYALEPTP